MFGYFTRTSTVGLLSILCLLLGWVQAADNTALEPTALQSATYLFAQNGVNITVSLTAVEDTGDIFFVMAAPTGYDWVSFGLGDKMAGSIMFVMYPTTNSSCTLYHS
jgi:hypothetical protein